MDLGSGWGLESIGFGLARARSSFCGYFRVRHWFDARPQPLVLKDPAKQTDHFRVSLIGGFGVVAGAFVAGEGVVSRVEQRSVARARTFQGAIDGLASRFGDV